MSTHEEKRYEYFRTMRTKGRPIRLESVLICPQCGRAYHIDMMHGASRNHCSAVACRLSHSGELRISDNIRRLKSYYQQKQLIAAEILTEAAYV